MSKDPGYSDSKKDTLESRNRFLQNKIYELTSEVAALDEAKQFFQERNRQLEAFLREIKNELSPFTHEDAILDVNVRIREILGE